QSARHSCTVHASKKNSPAWTLAATLDGTLRASARPTWGEKCSPRLHPASTDLGAGKKIAPERRCHHARCAVADRSTIDRHDRHDDLACRRYESLPCPVGLRNREFPLLEAQAAGSDQVENDAARDATQDPVVCRPRNELPIAGNDPGIA